MITCFSVVYKPHWASCVYMCCVFLMYWKMRAQEADHISDFVFCSASSPCRCLKITTRSQRGEPAPRRRALMMTKAGWRRWGSSGGCFGRRTETAGGRRGRTQTATLSLWRGSRTEERNPQMWLRARRRVSRSFIRSKLARSSEVLMTWPASRNYRSMSLEMYSVLDDLLFETLFEIQIASGFAAVKGRESPHL